MKKLTKKQIELFAKIHVANHAKYFDINAMDGVNLTDKEKEKIVGAVHKLAEQIGKNHPMNFGSNMAILKYLQENPTKAI